MVAGCVGGRTGKTHTCVASICHRTSILQIVCVLARRDDLPGSETFVAAANGSVTAVHVHDCMVHFAPVSGGVLKGAVACCGVMC